MPKARDISEDRVIVVGLGRFGRSVARTLHELGYEVRLSRVGLQPLSEGARITWLDNRNKGNSLELEPAWAQVFGPEPGP